MRWLLALGLMFAAVPAAAQTAALTSGPAGSTSLSGGSYGWRFTSTSDLTVISLGWYQVAPNYNLNHTIGIYQGTTLLGSAVVTGQSSVGYHYTAIAPITLQANTTYAIVGTNPDQQDWWVQWNTGAANNNVTAGITVLGYAANSASGNVLAAPTTTGSALAYVGPNFQILDAPEPGSWAMMIIGFGMAGISLRRRRSVAAA